MVAITTLVAPSGERLRVKTGVVCLQCENCVIHTWALQRWVPYYGALYKCLSLPVLFMCSGIWVSSDYAILNFTEFCIIIQLFQKTITCETLHDHIMLFASNMTRAISVKLKDVVVVLVFSFMSQWFCDIARLHPCYVYAACWLQSVRRRVPEESFNNVDYEACWERYLKSPIKRQSYTQYECWVSSQSACGWLMT